MIDLKKSLYLLTCFFGYILEGLKYYLFILHDKKKYEKTADEIFSHRFT
jgi:hypothetical protein